MFTKIYRGVALLGALTMGIGLLWGCSSGNVPVTTVTGGQTNTGGQTEMGTGGTTQGPAGSGGGDTQMPPTTVKAVLDAADTQFSTIVAGTADHDMRNQQMAAWLQSRPEFAEAGVTAGDSVWGRLKNGHLYIATSTFIPGEDGRAAPGRGAFAMPAHRIPATTFPFRRAAASHTALRPAQRGVTRDTEGKNELPQVAQARVLISLDKEFYNPPNNQIADLLRQYNYNVIQQSATVENLRSVQGDGAFYWGAHGDVSIDNRSKLAYWAVWTATDATDVGKRIPTRPIWTTVPWCISPPPLDVTAAEPTSKRITPSRQSSLISINGGSRPTASSS